VIAKIRKKADNTNILDDNIEKNINDEEGLWIFGEGIGGYGGVGYSRIS
jgi:hypothetical protein